MGSYGQAAGSIIGVGGTIASGILRGNAAKDALDKQKRALQRLQSIDVDAYKKEANIGDREARIQELENFRLADPELASVREASIARLNENLRASPGETGIGRVAGALERQALSEEPRFQILEGRLLDLAGQKLDQGAGLPAEFQAELVRTGLEQAGRSGVGADRLGPSAQRLGRLLASEQIALENQRQAQALGLAQGAQGLRTGRLNLLRGILPELANAQALQQNLATQAFQLAQANSPGGGLTGADILSLREANRELENQKILAMGQLKAQEELLKGEKIAGVIDAAVGGLANALGGAGTYQTANPLGQSGGLQNVGAGFGSLSPGSVYAGAGGQPYQSQLLPGGGGYSVPYVPTQPSGSGGSGGGGGGGGGFDLSSILGLATGLFGF